MSVPLSQKTYSILEDLRTYKVDIDGNGIKTRGFLDHGAQVTLVRKELLPAIGEKHGWSLEEDILVEETGLVKAMYCRQRSLSGV